MGNKENLLLQALPEVKGPVAMGSYSAQDVVFLLKDLSHISLEKDTRLREEAIQKGVHYSEMLPVEYQPTKSYIELFHRTLIQSAEQVAIAVGVVAEQIKSKRKANCVLVSLARAGTPIGVLIKRYLAFKYNLVLPHYSISIIRGKGIDENALSYIFQQHGIDADLQFVDGWTGKGAIRLQLIEACQQFQAKYGIALDDDLAVLADPGQCSQTFGTRADFLIPSACLNSTVSGLMSRTVLNEDYIQANDFHGAKYYAEWAKEDLSNYYVDTIVELFPKVTEQIEKELAAVQQSAKLETWQGKKDIAKIQQDFGITDINFIKPGVGETTRVLLRRIPWKILVNRLDNPNLEHIMLLAKERNVPVEVYPGLTYSCCGVIQQMKGEQE